MGFDKKLIVAKNTGLSKKREEKKQKRWPKYENKIVRLFTTNFEYIKDSIILIFIEEETEKGDLLEFINKNGVVCNFEYQKPAQIQARIKAD